MSTSEASAPRWLAALPAVLLVAVAAWETCATRRDATSVPGDDAWTAAEAVVRAQHQPGDLIVFAPAWVDPVGRLHLGDLISVDDAGRMDAARYARVWELSIRGDHAPEVAGETPAFEDASGDVLVRRYDRAAPARVVDDVRRHVPEVSPTRSVSDVYREVGFEPHACLELSVKAGTTMRVTFPKLQLGTTLVGYVGIPDVFERRDYRDPGTLSVEIAGATVASAIAGVDDGWVRFEAATTPGVAAVTFEVSTTGKPDQHRKLCFAAEARE
nr:hypothetical protein [Kofleriaceae bacterium]